MRSRKFDLEAENDRLREALREVFRELKANERRTGHHSTRHTMRALKAARDALVFGPTIEEVP